MTTLNGNAPTNVFGRHLADRAPFVGALIALTFALEATAVHFDAGEGVRTAFAFFADTASGGFPFWETAIVSMYFGIGAVAEAATAAAETRRTNAVVPAGNRRANA